MKITKASLLAKTPSLFAATQQKVYEKFFDTRWDSNEKTCGSLPKEFKLLYADYTYEDDSGDAYVLGYDKSKKQFFEVHGGHCSCYGLEGQWDVEYYSDLKQLGVVLGKRFDTSENEYYRTASSSTEFKAWLETEK